MLRLSKRRPGHGLARGDTGRRGYKARHLLAEIYRSQNRRADAETQWRRVVAEQPRFVPAWQKLGELYLADGRWAELDEVTIAMARVSEAEAADLKARANRALDKPTAAR